MNSLNTRVDHKIVGLTTLSVNITLYKITKHSHCSQIFHTSLMLHCFVTSVHEPCKYVN